MNPPIVVASRNGQIDKVRSELDRGILVDTPDYFGETALTEASIRGDLKMMELLVDKGADIDWPNLFGVTPLICVSQNGHLKAVILLVEKKALINVTNLEGNSALHCAARKGHFKIVEVLIEANANLHLKNNNGFIARDLAEQNGHSNVAQLLASKETEMSSSVMTQHITELQYRIAALENDRRETPAETIAQFKALQNKVCELQNENGSLRNQIDELKQVITKNVADCKKQLIAHFCGETPPEIEEAFNEWCAEQPNGRRKCGGQSERTLREQMTWLRRDAQICAELRERKARIARMREERERDTAQLMEEFRKHFSENWSGNVAERSEAAAQNIEQLEQKVTQLRSQVQRNKIQTSSDVRELTAIGAYTKSFIKQKEGGGGGTRLLGVTVCGHEFVCAQCDATREGVGGDECSECGSRPPRM